MKQSGIAWAGDIPSDWDVARTKYHFAGRKTVAGAREAEYARLALTMKGVVRRAKDDNTGLQPEKFETYQIIEKDDLVFKLIDLQNVSTSRVGRAPEAGLVSPAYIVLRAGGKVLPGYAEKWFLSLWKTQVFNRLGDDGVRSSLSAQDLLNLPIPVPPPEQQRAIAEFLDAKCAEIDHLAAEIQAQIELLEQYKRSVVTETVTAGLDPAAETCDSGVRWLGRLPRHWSVVRGK